MVAAEIRPTLDGAALLADLDVIPERERLTRLRAICDSDGPDEALHRIIAEAERLAVVEVTRATAAAELVVALADAAERPAMRVLARRALMQALAHAGRFLDALPVGDDAVAIGEAHGLPVEAARVRLASIQALANLGRYDDAIATGDAARAALAASGEPALAARADLSLGAVHQMRDDPATAMVHYDRARAGLVDEPVSLAQLDVNRGNALMGLDDFAGAAAAFTAAIPAFEAGGLIWAAAVADENLAYLAMRQGRLEAALRHFELARRRLEDDDSPAVLARLMAEQAEALAALGLLDEARACFEEVLPRLAALGLSLEEAQARAGLGRVLIRLGRTDAADVELTKAAKALDDLGHPTARARLDLIRADLLVRAGKLDEATSLAGGALAAFGERPADATVAQLALARIALERGDLKAAQRELDAALPAAEALDLAPVLGELRHLRGLLHRAAGRPLRAVADLRTAVRQVERLRGTLRAERFRVAFLGDRLAVYEDLVRQVLDVGGEMAVAEAFAVVERAKSRTLLDAVGGAMDLTPRRDDAATADPAETRLLTELAAVRAELNWHVSGLEEDVAGTSSLRGEGEHRSETIRRLERRLDGLQDRIAATGGQAGLFATPIGLETAQRLIPEGTALIEYFQLGDDLIAFVIGPESAQVVRRLAPAGETADQVRRLHFQIGRAIRTGGDVAGARAERLLSDARRELAAIRTGILAPVLAAVGDARRLLIVPHGALHTLPFHALWDGRRYLIETHEVQYAPSASLLAHLPPHRDDWGREALVVGVPDALAPRIAGETERVAATLVAGTTLLGRAATADRVTAAVENADVIHLACHGRFSSGGPLRSGLKLADRWLTVRDIYGLRLRADLVTLSGCDTGRAVIGGGDELVGLQRGFFAAGAASLLLSLWTVNDASTADLMTEFYTRWRAGASKTAALREAQLTGLARRAHPAFWAPFVLGGSA